VEEYLGVVHEQTTSSLRADGSVDDSPIRIGDVSIKNRRGEVVGALDYGVAGIIEVGFEVGGPVVDPVVSVTFHDIHGYLLGGLTTRLDAMKLDVSRDRGIAKLVLSPVIFTRGAYSVDVGIHDDRIQRSYDFRSGAAHFTVNGPSVSTREVSGHVVYPHRWEMEAHEE